MLWPAFGARLRRFSAQSSWWLPSSPYQRPLKRCVLATTLPASSTSLGWETQRDLQLVERRLDFHDKAVDRLLEMINGLMDQLDAQDQQIEHREAEVSRLAVKRL